MKKLLFALTVALLELAGPAMTQTSPNLIYGQVLTAAQWNLLFASKQDYLGTAPCPIGGCAMTGRLSTVASTAVSAGFNVQPGVAPTSPINGDIWTTASGIFVQINGSTLGPLLGGTQGANTILGNGSGTGVPVPLAIPSCSGAANAIQWLLNTGFQCGTITAAASSIAVATTTVTGGSIGNVFYHASGNLLGELTTSGTGTALALAAGATLTTTTITAPTISAPVLSGTITGTYTIGGTPSIPGSAINSGTISGSFMSAVNLASSSNGGVTGITPIANGGSGQATQAAAFNALAPTPTRAGDVLCYSGSTWATLAGNNSGTQVLTENASGVCSWSTVTGTGSVTSVGFTAGAGISLSGTNPITSSGSITINGAVPAPQGRITLAANTPVMGPTSCGGSSCAGQTTLRYDCFNGGQVPYYNGTTDLLDSIASCEVTDAMVAAASAGQVVNLQVYDVWWVHAGANRICIAMSSASGGGGGWASDTGGSNTARGTGYTEIDQTTRPYATNANSIANCFNGSTNYGSVAANHATYLGTVLANGNGSITYNLGTAASGGGLAVLGVWNAYNQVDVKTTVNDSKTSWPYASATIRYADNSTLNAAVFVVGLPNNSVAAWYYANASGSGAGGGIRCGFAMDGGANGPFDASGVFQQSGSTNIDGECAAFNNYDALIGSHTLQAYEQALGGLTTGIQTSFGGQGLGIDLRM